ncbi:MAG: EFR1 family ferrodoxin [Deltaproteobacteria bacterium]|uniref:EFR1 family ferrodoxin n=1 Tax=Candidatus Zymogenus saltonus TaxID=2844893 RepID=A0A9D8PNA9_9DELT|nr:EFR1 family ferrodoxin [Candidatus Zymogenus saltonus]
MSGTGNSYRVAAWIDEFLRKQGADSQIRSVDGIGSEDRIKETSRDLLGIVHPTHGFTAPWHVIKFASRLPRGRSTRAFTVATRAGLKFGSLFLPGIAGSATFITALILFLKGYRVRGLMSVDMPSNWFSLHKIQGRKKQREIIERSKPAVEGFIRKIHSGGRVLFTLNNLYELLLGALLSLISFAYLLMGRFFLAKLFFANDRCNGCGICAKNCPVGGIKMRGKNRPRPFWKYNCESCMRCAAVCPQNCVEAGHSWGVILYLATTIPSSMYILSYLGTLIHGLAESKGEWLGTVIDLMFFYLAIFTLYYVFYALIRIPFFNRLFTYTTLTHLPFWGRYREPDTVLKKLKGK